MYLTEILSVDQIDQACLRANVDYDKSQPKKSRLNNCKEFISKFNKYKNVEAVSELNKKLQAQYKIKLDKARIFSYSLMIFLCKPYTPVRQKEAKWNRKRLCAF